MRLAVAGLLAGLALALGASAFGATQPFPSLALYATLGQLAASTDYLGSYTIAGGLPDPVANNGKRIAVPDLGGQPGGFLRASGGCWVRVSTATARVQSVPVATSVSVDGLASSPILALTGSAFASRASISITNACSMPQVTLVAAPGVFSALGSLGIGLSTGNSLTVAGIGTAGTWADYAISADGSNITKIRGGSL